MSGPISATSAAAIISATTLFGADGAAAAASVLYSLSLTGPAARGLATADGDFPITLVAVSATEIQGQFDGTNIAFSIVINGDGTLTVTQNVALEHLVDGSTVAAHDDTLSLAGLITATVTTRRGWRHGERRAQIGAAITFDDDGVGDGRSGCQRGSAGRDERGRRLCVGPDQRHQCGGDHLGHDAVWRRWRGFKCLFSSYVFKIPSIFPITFVM